MNFLKTYSNSSLIRNLILLLGLTLLAFTKVDAQQPTDTTYIRKLYDSSIECYTNGDNYNALKILSKVLQFKSGMPSDHKPKYYRVYNALGLVCIELGDFSNGISYFEKALKSTSNPISIAVISGGIANCYSMKSDYPKAICYYENTLPVFEKCDRKDRYRLMAAYYTNIGLSYLKLLDYNRAKNCFLKGIWVAEKNQIGGFGDAYFNCGLAYQKLDSLEKANRYFKKAKYYFKKEIESNIKAFGENHYKTGMAYMNYAMLCSEISEFTTSEQLFRRAYKTLTASLGDKHYHTAFCLKNYAEFFYRRGSYRQALEYCQKSLISNVYSFNDTSVYVNPNAEILPDMDLLDILKLKAQAFAKLAEQQSKIENLEAALSTLELTVGFIERLRTGYLYEASKLQMAANEHETYLSIIEIANSLYKISSDSKYIVTAFRYAEYSKYAVLREVKNDEMAKGVAGIPDSIHESERNIELQISNTRRQVEVENKLEHPNRSKLEEWNRQLLTLTLKLEGQIQLLEKNYPAYYKLKYSNQVVSLPQLQKAMEEKEAIIEYVLSDNALYTFAITKDTFQLVKQDADTAFLSSINHFTDALHSDLSLDYVELRGAAYSLYQKLILPVEPLLKGKSLLIIPDGRLGLIAFDALIYRPSSPKQKYYFINEPFLIRKYPIGYASSATLYSYSLGDDRKGNPSFLGIAPSFRVMRDSLGWLLYGEKSVKRLAWLTFGKSLTGRSATEENFRRYCGEYDIIHIHTHGLEDTLNPSRSRLVMARPTSPADNRYLYAWEVYGLQMRPRMTVLASCYSGSGKLSNGEGVMSMGRSFIYAGSQSVVISLWIGYDKPMYDLLNSFYLNLFKGMRKDEALRLAKLEYLKNTQSFFSNPHFWAGLVVNGNQHALYHYWYLKKIILAVTIIVALTLIFWKRRAIKRLVNRIGSQLL